MKVFFSKSQKIALKNCLLIVIFSFLNVGDFVRTHNLSLSMKCIIFKKDMRILNVVLWYVKCYDTVPKLFYSTCLITPPPPTILWGWRLTYLTSRKIRNSEKCILFRKDTLEIKLIRVIYNYIPWNLIWNTKFLFLWQIRDIGNS